MQTSRLCWLSVHKQFHLSALWHVVRRPKLFSQTTLLCHATGDFVQINCVVPYMISVPCLISQFCALQFHCGCCVPVLPIVQYTGASVNGVAQPQLELGSCYKTSFNLAGQNSLVADCCFAFVCRLLLCPFSTRSGSQNLQRTSPLPFSAL